MSAHRTMSSRALLFAIGALMVLNGAVETHYEAAGTPPIGWTLGLALAFSFLVFAWYRHDSDEQGYRRSIWLNMGVLVASPLAVPYYLLRSRPAGRRLRAILRLAGFAVLMVLATAAGMIAAGGLPA